MSLNPADYVQGGLLDDVDVTFETVRFVEFDYGGTTDKPVLALHAALVYDDNGKAASVDQYFSAGDLSRFQPSEDGTHAVAVGSAKGMADSTNAALLIKSILDCGFPIDKFGDGDVSAMDGLVAHVNRIPQPKRGGNIPEKNAAGFDKTVMIVTKIHQMPWETPGQPGRPASARPTARTTTTARTAAPPATRTAAPAPSNTDATSDDLTIAAAEILVQVLDAKQGTVAKTGISSGAFRLLAGNADRTAILKNITDDDWLYNNGENFGWSYDGKTVTAG